MNVRTIAVLGAQAGASFAQYVKAGGRGKKVGKGVYKY